MICPCSQVLYYASPGLYSSSAPQSSGGYYAVPAAAAPASPPLTPLFGIQTSPGVYSSKPATYSPAPVPYYSSPAAYSSSSPLATLFGSPRFSPPSPVPAAYSLSYSSPAPYALASPRRRSLLAVSPATGQGTPTYSPAAYGRAPAASPSPTLFGAGATTPSLYGRSPAALPYISAYGVSYSAASYGAAPYSPAPSPSPTVSPYYGMATAGMHSMLLQDHIGPSHAATSN